MRQLNLKNRLLLPGVHAGSPLLPRPDVWEVLERYTREIGHCERTSRQKVLALEAIRDSIAAAVVFWYPGTTTDPIEIAGERSVPADWCSAFAEKLFERTPGLDGELLRSVLPPEPGNAPFHPCSAAMVRVSKSKGTWLVALNARRSFQVTDLRIMALVRQILTNHRRRCDLTNRMSETLTWLVQCLTTSIDAHVPHARGHSERVAKTAVEIAKRMHLPTPVLGDLYFAGLLHDIGITGVRQNLLLKPGKLTDDEYAQVKIYPVIGDGILAGIRQLAHLRPAVRHHHERYDGQGYPDGLVGEDIPLLARILAVADAFDAMQSPRPYRPALSSSRVESILAEGALFFSVSARLFQ